MPSQLDFIYDSNTFIDLYVILDIDMDAKQDEIKNAYLSLVKKYHPDHGGSTDKFEEVTRAYEVLYNRETRKEYDLYYLKKNMDEFKGDHMLKLKDQYKDFVKSTSKPISKDELDKLYSETFDDVREKYKETKIDSAELANRVNDLMCERNNFEIESSDNTLANFMAENGKDIDINDVFEYFKYKNQNCFGSNSIVLKEWGTLDTLPGYSDGYSAFVNEQDYFTSGIHSNIADNLNEADYINSNLYSNISSMNNFTSHDTIGKNMTNLNYDEFIKWKSGKKSDTKLTESEMDLYLKKREEEQQQLFNEVETDLSNKTKRKEVEKFLKTKHIGDDIEKYYDRKHKNTNTEQSSKSSKLENLDDILNYMEKVREEDFPIYTPKSTSTSEQPATDDDLRSVYYKKASNVRKRENK